MTLRKVETTCDVEIALSNATYSFSPGVWLARDGSVFRPATRWERVKAWVGRVVRRATWWRQERCVVVAVDHADGSVTCEPLRWSWRRWKWERP